MDTPHTTDTRQKRRRGFALLPTERRRELASRGGKAAHAHGTAHTWTREEAREAGRKGGAISRRRPRSNTP